MRKECAPLVSIAIWHNISSDAKRDKKLEENTQLRRAWRASLKRYNTADDATKARLRFERAWLYSSILDFFNRLYNPNSGGKNSLMPLDMRLIYTDDSLYCERFIEFLSDLQSQLPTRRYFNSLLRDLNTLAVIQLSPMYHDEHNSLIRDLFALLKHYTYFSIDDHTGIQYSSTDTYDQHCTELALLQRVALKHFKSKLTILALSNYASIDKRSELENHLKLLTDAELVSLCEHLELRTSYPNSCQVLVDRQFFLELLLSLHERRKTFQETARELNVLPTERSLLDSSLSRTEEYNGTRPLAIPKLNLQYLTVGDFLWRSFILHRCESFYAIKKDAEETIKRLRPKADGLDATRFEGFFRMALPISKPA